MRWQRGTWALLLVGLVACADREVTGPSELTPQYAAPSATLVESVTGAIVGGAFTGTARITEFGFEDGELVVSGVLSGVAVVGGVATSIVDQAFTTGTTLTSSGTGKCGILFLDLGPIFLDVLGLQVDLSQVVLDVSAVAGAGNLLGNLLCAVVHLLDNPLGSLNGLLNLLDRINDILN